MPVYITLDVKSMGVNQIISGFRLEAGGLRQKPILDNKAIIAQIPPPPVDGPLKTDKAVLLSLPEKGLIAKDANPRPAAHPCFCHPLGCGRVQRRLARSTGPQAADGVMRDFYRGQQAGRKPDGDGASKLP